MSRRFRITPDELKNIAKEALEHYNRMRAPEAVAKLVKIEDNLLYVEFSGSYCETCGLYDWIEDLKYVLEDLGVEAELIDVIEPENPENDKRIGIFRVNNINTLFKRVESNMRLIGNTA